MMRVLILTAGYGEGHNSAARGVAEGLELVAPGEVEATVVDLFDVCYGRANDVVKKAYLSTINHAPGLWEKIYNVLDRTSLVEATLPTMKPVQDELARRLDEAPPDAVVATYPAYGFLLDRLFEAGSRPFPFFTIITDSVTVNSVWRRATSDYFIVANNDTAEVLREHVPTEKIHVLGFPVSPRFAMAARERPLPSSETRPRVLYMINAGRKDAPAIVDGLLARGDLDVTVTVGRDEDLREEIAGVAAERKREIEIHGWTNQLPELLMTHHLLISKAGGATTQETIAAKTPMIISQVVPGQEEGNARLLVENRCGCIAATPAEIGQAVEGLFANNAALWREWHENIAKLSRPDSAREIARFVLSVASGAPKEPSDVGS
jgi:processive 1,2-diacylglycerol beta-glucosyltransferase